MRFKVPLKSKIAALVVFGVIGLASIIAVLGPRMRAEESPRTTGADTSDERRWQAVAPGRVEPKSGEIRIMAPVIGRIDEVLAKVNDKVFGGELLVRLDDEEVRGRVDTAEAQVALRKRVRNDQSASSRASDRRKAEDAVADAEKAVVDAQAALDNASVAKRSGRNSNIDLGPLRLALSSAQERQKQRRNALHKLEADSGTPLPTQAEGQLNIARTELVTAQAALDKMAVRSPIDATVLQSNAKLGELANPSAAQPLIVLGDLSSLRVRAEVDERDFGEIKIGQAAIIRATAFRGREFTGTVTSIAPIVETGRLNARGQRNLTDVNVVEVLVDVTEPGPLAVGMKVDVYFQYPNQQPGNNATSSSGSGSSASTK